MPITGKFFPSQKSEEKVFLLLRRHWVSYGGFIFLFIVMLIPLFIFLIYTTSSAVPLSPETVNVIYLVLPAYLLVIMGLLLYGFVDYYLDVYIVTNERIVNISQNGFFKRDISELHLHQVQDVSAKEEGIFPTFFHYGDVTIQTAGERENFVFKSVPHPYSISKKIVDLHEAQLEETQKEELELGKGDFTESLRPDVLSLARKRTKDFFKGEEPLDSGVSVEDIRKVSDDVQSKNVLLGIDSAKDGNSEDISVENSPEPQSNISLPKKEVKIANKDSKATPKNANIAKKEERKNSNDEIELHENEEIDL